MASDLTQLHVRMMKAMVRVEEVSSLFDHELDRLRCIHAKLLSASDIDPKEIEALMNNEEESDSDDDEESDSDDDEDSDEDSDDDDIIVPVSPVKKRGQKQPTKKQPKRQRK